MVTVLYSAPKIGAVKAQIAKSGGAGLEQLASLGFSLSVISPHGPHMAAPV